MLLVKTQIGLSEIHGIGLFAAQFIAKGTVTWQYHPDFDSAYSESDILRMPEPAREQFLKYAYYDKELELYILCSDDQRFINHEPDFPNIISTPRQDVTARDIVPGEELLCDYNCYDDTYFARVGLLQFSRTLSFNEAVIAEKATSLSVG
ncbi:MAG: SET domain-containing protein-lysine N-methyltransferase [Nostoc sp.]|uniref:SET domain-containing protein n=1 Tax=Nostoc sp. TaxID=1180 RepID=UPI002FF75168